MTIDPRHFAEGVFLVYAALLPIVNPLGAMPVFLAMTRYSNDSTRTILARKVTFNSFILLMASLFIGTYVLEFFGISIPVVQVAGGLVVCSVAWDLLRKADVSTKAGAEDLHDPDTIATEAFYPLTLPLTIGPGAISVAITIGANHPRTVRSFVEASLSSLLGVILMCVTVYFCYRHAKRLSTWLGATGTAVVVRLSAFILLCIGVQIMWNGVDTLAGITGHPHVSPP
ncbi:MAG: MarC family protein [Betaproteobacteria bacterium]